MGQKSGPESKGVAGKKRGAGGGGREEDGQQICWEACGCVFQGKTEQPQHSKKKCQRERGRQEQGRKEGTKGKGRMRGIGKREEGKGRESSSG